jgi:hypothetical protein
MFGFFSRKKEVKEDQPPRIRPDDDLARTADLVQATGDCAKAEGDGMILMFRSGLLQPQQFFPHFLKTDVFILVKYLNNLNAPMFLNGKRGQASLTKPKTCLSPFPRVPFSCSNNLLTKVL